MLTTIIHRTNWTQRRVPTLQFKLVKNLSMSGCDEMDRCQHISLKVFDITQSKVR